MRIRFRVRQNVTTTHLAISAQTSHVDANKLAFDEFRHWLTPSAFAGSTFNIVGSTWDTKELVMDIDGDIPSLNQIQWKTVWAEVGKTIVEIEATNEMVVFYHGNRNPATIFLDKLLLTNCKISNAGTTKDKRIHIETLMELKLIKCKYVGSCDIYFGDPLNAHLKRTCVIDEFTTNAKAVYSYVYIATRDGDTITNLIPDVGNIVLYGFDDCTIDLDTVISKKTGKSIHGKLKPVNCTLTSKDHWFYYTFAGTTLSMTQDKSIVDNLVNGQPTSNNKANSTSRIEPNDCIIKGMDITILQPLVQDTTVSSSDPRALYTVEKNRFDSCEIEIVHAKFGTYIATAHPNDPDYMTNPTGCSFVEPTIVGESIYPINHSHMTGCEIKARVPKSNNEDGRKTCVCLTEYVNVQADANLPVLDRNGKRVFPLSFASESKRMPFGIKPIKENNYLRDVPMPKPNKLTLVDPDNAEYFKYFYTTIIRSPEGGQKVSYPPFVFWMTNPRSLGGIPIQDKTVGSSKIVTPKGVPSGCMLLQSAIITYEPNEFIPIAKDVIVEYSESAIDQFIRWLQSGVQTITVSNVDVINDMNTPYMMKKMIMRGETFDNAFDIMSIGTNRVAKFTKVMCGYEEAFSKAPKNVIHGNRLIPSNNRAHVEDTK